MTKRKSRRMPVLGSAFDAEQRNEVERIRAYIAELEYYRPRGFSGLTREGATLCQKLMQAELMDDAEAGHALAGDASEAADEWKEEVESLLTDWARRACRHDFISFGPFPHSGDVGFLIDVETAMADADLLLFLARGDVPPKGFSGLACTINDHGNVTAQTYSRGRMCRELFAVV